MKHYFVGNYYNSKRPLLVTMICQATGKRFGANIFMEGGYDWTVMEGAPVCQKLSTGIFLGTSSRNPYGRHHVTGEWVKDTECIWHLHESWGSMPAGDYKICVNRTPKGVMTEIPSDW